MRTGISFVVIGFALAGAIGGAVAQYFPPQPPLAGYPPSAHDPYPAGPPPPYQRADPYPDTAGRAELVASIDAVGIGVGGGDFAIGAGLNCESGMS